MKIHLLAWSGDSTALAARLGVNESELVARLKRAAVNENTARLVVPVQLANSGPVMDGVARMLRSE